jgi:predicted GNAT family acetyltransferase
MSNNVRDNSALNRFELDTDGHISFSEDQRGNGMLTLMHTEVPKELGGRGIGSTLISGVLVAARAQGLKVKPLCPFAKAYIERHPEYADLTQ